jgi:transposase-like protein
MWQGLGVAFVVVRRRFLSLLMRDRVVLSRWSRRPKSPHSEAQRARIVLLAADGLESTAIAARVGVHEATVGKWRRRYLAGGVDALIDEPRPGAPRKIGDDAVEAVVLKTEPVKWSLPDCFLGCLD